MFSVCIHMEKSLIHAILCKEVYIKKKPKKPENLAKYFVGKDACEAYFNDYHGLHCIIV